MKDNASFTAHLIAVARGLGRVLPSELQLVHDPFGERFSTPALDFVRKRADGFWMKPLLERVLVGVQLRTRFIDATLESFLDHTPGAQVVLLGAGFDARAWRYADALAKNGGRVFEVDHPRTQEVKRAKLDALPHVAFLPFDFEARAPTELPDALAQLGHDRARPTLTIWEGVTMYLSEAAVDATTRAVARYSATSSAGASCFVFTYVDRAVIRAPGIGSRVAGWFVAGLAEPLRFGFVPAELGAYLAERGVRLEHDANVAELARLMLPPDMAKQLDAPTLHIVVARV